ncbi:MAG: hypothetical protein ACP5O1_05875 [Phycisphaerae bacterium]
MMMSGEENRQLGLFDYLTNQSSITECPPLCENGVDQLNAVNPLDIYPAEGRRARREFFERLVNEMKQAFGISIRKWRQSMSGVAYELHYSNGDVKRLISSPHPRSPVSACIFLHEVGHHAIGFRKFRPRCLEEYHVWQWAFEQMRLREIPIDGRVERHYRRSMHHYVCLAKKRGLRQVPPELIEFQRSPL